MTNYPESDISREKDQTGNAQSGWLKFALLTAASAVAGGLATAWFYRKTLNRLRETGESTENTNFGRESDREPTEIEDDF